MAEKRLLLERSETSEPEKLEIHMTRRVGVLHVIQHRSFLVSRKSVLGLLVSFVFCYFLIGRPEWANVLDLDVLHSDNYVTVQHHSTVMDVDPDTLNETIQIVPKGFLVYSNSCRIMEVDPYKNEVMRHFKRVKYKACQKLPPLTRVKFQEKSQKYILSIDGAAFSRYPVSNHLHCCYMEVQRVDEMKVKYTKCQTFKGSTELPNSAEGIIVKCDSNGRQFYINGHATIPVKEEVQQRLQQATAGDRKENVIDMGNQRPPSVLMLGIDSISRVNLIRAMPKTAQYLYDNEWFELAGYNKVDDNTFPNIMAVATGYNLPNAMHACSPFVVGGLDKCNYIWKLYQQRGYVTAYAEDAVKINTFNYLKKGFKDPPADYYLRPYLSAAESQLDHTTVNGLVHCLGYETAAEHVYDYGLEFTRRFLNDTYFGFFWTNTHSHSDISQTSSMDDYIADYLRKLVRQGTMENTVVVFFSDHGMRFGPTRATWSGHLEERLPAIFIWLPHHLRRKHPEFVRSLKLNKNRLTTPYDLHLTMKHILATTGRADMESLGPAPDCPQCQSLLRPVSPQRSCSDVGIADHWCTCWEYDTIASNSKESRMLGKRVVGYLNNYVAEFRNGTFAKLCAPLSLHSIKSAFRAHQNALDPEEVHTYRLIFVTSPNKGQYEATVRHNHTDDSVKVTGSVSRLNVYSGEADCMSDFAAKKYCYCRKKKG
ncbi:uncharacterized protein LOC108109879 isoform X1 [Drosophila eugracilis]|uniref:uncharacterized protein LOC108109879 isoform X1 n=1 Tax=Drosophila eugracilis TaxID=29029 RepID=UPI0007E5CA6E|nr:uncharacterized protein LOC108109879 isoform X1 [Drosophila eugracilis]XP_017074165.1 uncharacterized protein LOC108109879 isoform X1 [Drosophila eugracilis]XP_017074167.1 uncharacterized protein LOC108109879 isoform X1 [Drosophila eugracilis]XP_017074168.1 uncharacterized protein LOC108109879 isoform X1 [Drosophila eugracilis]